MSATVYLVGAGPGDPGLITVRGLEALRRADVVVYDRLVAAELLAEARTDAERIFVGKRRGDQVMPQEQIHALLIELARSGKSVCRLKGGDPFIFGRGGEEAEALADAGVPFEVVPGVTAGLAAPAFAGIPLTHREVASSVAFVTGHDEAGAPDARIDWQRLATATDTIVVYMGVLRLADIARQLIQHGRAPHTPAAVVRWGSTRKQVVLTGTVADLAEQVEAAGLRPPAIIIIGEVVKLRERMQWFEARPLWGQRIVVTRPRAQAAEFVQKLEALGAHVIEFPVIVTEPVFDPALPDALAKLDEYDLLIFTSVNGVDHFIARMEDPARWTSKRICAVGPMTAERLRALGCANLSVPDDFIAEGVIAGLSRESLAGQRILLPRAAAARDVLPRELTARGAIVDVLPVYRTVGANPDPDALRSDLLADRVAAVTFTSGSAVQHFVRLVGAEILQQCAGRFLVATIGPSTSELARELGMTVDLEAVEHTTDGLVAALLAHLSPDRA